MPLSYFRRPLCLLLIAYMLVLALLHAWGFFRVSPPAAWDRFLWQNGIKVEGIVVSGSADKRLGERMRIRIGRIENQIPPSAEDIFAYLPKRRPENEALRPGQRIALWGRLRRPRWPRNPGEFDELGFCSDRGIAFLLQAKRFEIMEPSVPWRWRPWAWAEAAHRSIHRMLTQSLPVPEASLWEGILLGYKGSLPTAVNQNIQDAGVMHLLVPSGAKMAFVLALCLWMASRLGLGLWLRAFVSAAVGGFYALVVGAEPPYLRAYGSALIGFLARRLERDPLGFQAIVLSAWSILLVSPRELFSAGFQMTYAAMLGIMIAMPRWKVAARWPLPVQAMARLSMVSFVVQLMLWPILAWIFGRVSVIGLAANAVLVPASGIYMAAGFAAWILYCLPWPRLFQITVPCLSFLARIFQKTCSVFAACPGAAWSVGPMSWTWTAVFYVAAFGLLAVPRWSVTWKAWAVAGLAALILVVPEKHRQAEIIFLEKSGEGAILARLPDGQDWLLACTLRPSGLRPSLAALGISRLDGVLISAGPSAGEEARSARQMGVPIREIDVLRPGFHKEWANIRLELVQNPPLSLGEGVFGWVLNASPLRISSGQISLSLGRGKSVVSDGHSQFCILHSSFASFEGRSEGAPGTCGPQDTVGTRRDGAVWVQFNDSSYVIDSQRQRYSVGHPLL